MDLIAVGLAAAGLIYLALVAWLGTPTPFMLVRGGSMEPAFHAGDLLLSRRVAPSHIRVGDVIAFDTPDELRRQRGLPARLAHRVASVESKNGQLLFVTKGDNSDTDRLPVPSSSVRGVVAANLGVLGRPLLWLANTRLLLMFGAPAAAFVVVAVLVSSMTPSGQGSAPAADAAGASSLRASVGRLARATAEYGAHLESHTGAIKALAATARHLHAAAVDQARVSNALHTAVARQNRVLDRIEAAGAGSSARPVAPERRDSGGQGAKAA